MTARYVVRWTPEAEADAVDWFDDPFNAEKVIVQFGAKADSHQARVMLELREIGVLTYLEVFHKPWQLVFKIQAREVWIMAVLDDRRDLADVLFERLAR